MSPGSDETRVLRARLEWLRLMGVEALPRTGQATAAPVEEAMSPSRDLPGTPGAAAGPASGASLGAIRSARPGSASLQGGLFGETPVPEWAGAPPGPASPLATLLAAATASQEAPDAALAAVREEIGDCRRCRLSERRTTIVFGVGSPRARLMFVGEGPGADEDAQGEPFVGRAGHLLTRIIEAMGLTRADVYIANIVKCRPPENRTPLPDEVATCSPFLLRQIAAIRPEVIVCLGTPAAQTLLGTRETITRIRGSFRELEGIRVMPTFHPAYLLRNPAAKRDVWEDMKRVMAALALSG